MNIFRNNDKTTIQLALASLTQKHEEETDAGIMWVDRYEDPANQYQLFTQLAGDIWEQMSDIDDVETAQAVLAVSLIRCLAEIKMMEQHLQQKDSDVS